MRNELVNSLRDDHQLSIYRIKGSVFQIESFRVNIRTTVGVPDQERCWFDVTPQLYENDEVDFFIFVCRCSSWYYVIPAARLADMVSHANLCGSKQVPNFNLHLDTHEFVPCGSSERFDVEDCFMNVTALSPN
ncbi:MAG: hypothetical protein GXP26_10165 [Planctomycetes bacterium]|nr:hypothetical protein [Planctomycetota bacterium]